MLPRGRRRARVAAVVAGVVTMTGGVLAGYAGADTGGPSPAALAAQRQPLVPGTPCSISARSCVDLESQRAWLIQDGKVIRGPVGISSGAVGQETPIGHSFRVYRKSKDHKTQEFRLADGSPAPMPWAVFFADGGIAFHEGNTAAPSAGCIRMKAADAQAWFENLQIGDQVQVVRASEENAARGLSTEKADNSDNSDKPSSDDDEDSDNSESDD
jgi:hypothetical protein